VAYPIDFCEGCLHMTPRPPKEKRHSPSAIKTFEQCPKKWQFQYRLRPPIDRKIGPPLILGNAIHTVLERLMEMPAAERDLPAAQDMLRKVWATVEGRGEAFESRDQEREFGERGLGILASYAETPDWQVTPLHVEQWAQLDLPGGSQLFGKIDRVDALDDGIEIIDYKTGKCKIPADALDQDIGAQVYAVAAENTWQKPVRRVRFIFLEAGVDRIWEPDEDLIDLRELLADEVDTIETTTDFETRKTPLCNWCDYQAMCPAFAAV